MKTYSKDLRDGMGLKQFFEGRPDNQEGFFGALLPAIVDTALSMEGWHWFSIIILNIQIW